MTRFLALWTYLAGLDPHDATVLAARSEGLERFEVEALAIVRSESRGRAVGLHGEEPGRVAGRRFWRAAVAAGLLTPETCECHLLGTTGARWGIRGAHGHAAAYAVSLIGDCIAAEAIDVPWLSALAAVRRLRILERRYKLRTPEARSLAWRVGVGAARRSLRPR